MKQSSSLPKSRAHAKPSAPLTREHLAPYFQDLKDFVQLTAKASETRIKKELGKEIDGVRSELKITQVAVLENARAIKTLDKKIDGVRTELKEEIQGVRTGLTEEMHLMEKRLSDKFDGHGERLDDHDVRLTALETR